MVLRPKTLTQRLWFSLISCVLLTGLLTVIALEYAQGNTWMLIGVFVFLFLVLSLLCLRWSRRISKDLSSLEVALLNLSDANFSVSMPPPELPEMDTLVQQMNRSFGDLRRQRQSIYQRELMLDTMIETSPVAMILCGGSGHIYFANAAARQLLFKGERRDGAHLVEALSDNRSEDSEEFARVILQGRETFFSLLLSSQTQSALAKREGEKPADETMVSGLRSFHYLCSEFSIDRQPHRLHLLKDITREVNRQEAASWKKTIRVISHELNNSLAPISSMAHSCQLLLERGESERLMKVLQRIETGVGSLHEFIQRYASFARLPKPQLAPVSWLNFVQQLQEHFVFHLPDGIPDWELQADSSQLQQALLNLLKNAHESGSETENIILRFKEMQQGTRIEVIDQGGGMSSEVMEQALLPFYSTKPLGSGIGLALCREIVEAHQGQMSLDNYRGGLRVAISLPGQAS